MPSLYNANHNPATLMGLAANRPAGAALQQLPFGTRYIADDTGVESFVTGILTGTRAWTGAGLDQLSKYWVNTAGAEPVAPYNLPSQAIAAAVADGHTTGIPAAVLILPGNYADPGLTLQPGIDLIGMGGWNVPDAQNGVPTATPNTDVVITANVALAAGFTRCCLRGIRFVGTGNTFDFGASATFSSLTMQFCRVESPVSSCFVGAPTAIPSLFLHGTTVVASNAGAKAINVTTTWNLFVTGSTKISGATAAENAITFVGGTHIFRGASILGSVVYTAAAGGDSYEDTDLTVTGQSAITLFAGTTVTYLRGAVLGATAGATIAGAGTINFIGVRTDANGLSLSTVGVITASEDGTIQPYTQTDFGAASPVSASGILAEVSTVDTSGGARSFTLPVIASIPKGRRATISALVGGANAITVTPAGAELLNGVNAGIATSAAIKGSMRVIRGTAGWLVDAAS